MACPGRLARRAVHETWGWVSGAVFSKDESLILTWSNDGSARLWHARDGSPAGQPMKHEKAVSGAVFSKDESLILTWSDDGSARLWHIGADYDFPNEYLPLQVEFFTGTQMDEVGNISVIESEKWNLNKKKYLEIAEKHYEACQYKDANLYSKLNQFLKMAEEK